MRYQNDPRARLHDCLDGELPRELLSPAERAELAELEAPLDKLGRALHFAAVPDVASRVLERIAREQSAVESGRTGWVDAATRAVDWLWRPRPWTFRPVYAFLLVLVVAGGLIGLGRLPLARSGPPLIYVQFTLSGVEAREVTLAGSFTGWQPRVSLSERSPGVWTATVPVRPGVHDYTYLVDGERWMVDPNALQADDGFGGRNNRMPVPVPESRS